MEVQENEAGIGTGELARLCTFVGVLRAYVQDVLHRNNGKACQDKDKPFAKKVTSSGVTTPGPA